MSGTGNIEDDFTDGVNDITNNDTSNNGESLNTGEFILDVNENLTNLREDNIIVNNFNINNNNIEYSEPMKLSPAQDAQMGALYTKLYGGMNNKDELVLTNPGNVILTDKVITSDENSSWCSLF